MKGPQSRSSQVPRSLLQGVTAAACAALDVRDLRHRSELRTLTDADGRDVVSPVFRQIASNYERAGASANKNRSQENWRWRRPQMYIAPHNRSPEVVLERAIVSASERLGRADLANQIPVASGLIAGSPDARRAIDLVQQRGESSFEFVELKVGSDSPLYAAVEIVAYACLWILARFDPPARQSDILAADQLDLRVLAPAAYYSSFDLRSIERMFDAGVSTLGDDHGLGVTFAFHVVGTASISFPPLPDIELLEMFDTRRALHN